MEPLFLPVWNNVGPTSSCTCTCLCFVIVFFLELFHSSRFYTSIKGLAVTKRYQITKKYQDGTTILLDEGLCNIIKSIYMHGHTDGALLINILKYQETKLCMYQKQTGVCYIYP